MVIIEKQKELGLWHDWKGGNKQSLPTLLRSMDPLIQQQVNKFQAAAIPRTAIEAQGRALAVKAFEDYDPNKGAALNTHVFNHLKHLQRYVIDYQNVGKIPEHRGIQISRFRNIKRNLEEELGREPNVIELSEALDWSQKEVNRMVSEQRTDVTLRQSLEESGWYDKDALITDPTKELLEFVYHDPNLTMEEKKAMEYFFGMGNMPRLSVKEIALKMNKPESYIRKIGKKISSQVLTAKRKHQHEF